MSEKNFKFRNIFSKGWSLHTAGNKLCVNSAWFVIISLLITLVLLIPAFVPLYSLSAETITLLLIVIAGFNAIALLLVLIGRFIYWKGVTHMLGTAKFVMSPEAPRVAPQAFDPSLLPPEPQEKK